MYMQAPIKRAIGWMILEDKPGGSTRKRVMLGTVVCAGMQKTHASDLYPESGKITIIGSRGTLWSMI
jgi:hypothetical protein